MPARLRLPVTARTALLVPVSVSFRNPPRLCVVMQNQTPVWRQCNIRASLARARPTCSGATASSGPATGSGNDGGHKTKSGDYQRLTAPFTAAH